MKAMSVTADSFEADVLDSQIPVLIDFWAPWCPPCRAVAPVLDQIAADYDGRLKVMKVNIDEEPSIAEVFGVRSIPTLVVVHGRKVVSATTGAMPRDALVRTLELDLLTAPAGA
jgi:thioredoxin 1